MTAFLLLLVCQINHWQKVVWSIRDLFALSFIWHHFHFTPGPMLSPMSGKKYKGMTDKFSLDKVLIFVGGICFAESQVTQVESESETEGPQVRVICNCVSSLSHGKWDSSRTRIRVWVTSHTSQRWANAQLEIIQFTRWTGKRHAPTSTLTNQICTCTFPQPITLAAPATALLVPVGLRQSPARLIRRLEAYFFFLKL